MTRRLRHYVVTYPMPGSRVQARCDCGSVSPVTTHKPLVDQWRKAHLAVGEVTTRLGGLR